MTLLDWPFSAEFESYKRPGADRRWAGGGGGETGGQVDALCKANWMLAKNIRDTLISLQSGLNTLFDL